MTLDTETLRRSAVRARAALTALVALMAGGIVLTLLWAMVAPDDIAAVLAQPGRRSAAAIGLAPFWGIVALALVQAVLWLLALVRLRALFAGLAAPGGFAAGIAAPARAAAFWMWAALAWSVLAQVPASALATWTAGPGGRAIALSLGSGQFLALVAAIVTGMMARAMQLSAELWADHREIV